MFQSKYGYFFSPLLSNNLPPKTLYPVVVIDCVNESAELNESVQIVNRTIRVLRESYGIHLVFGLGYGTGGIKAFSSFLSPLISN